MNYYFPVSINKSKVVQFAPSEWSNSMNLYEILRFSIEKPSFLFLHRADTICPAPKMPFVDLAYLKDRNGKVEVIIQASAMQHEIALEDYYEYFSKTSNETIVQKRLINNDSDGVDLLVVKTFEDGQKWITRRTGFKTWMGSGAFVITLNFACNEEVYNGFADLFFYMMDSFKLLEKPSYHLAEELKLVARKYPLDFGTYIPMSWQMASPQTNTMDEMQANFRKKYRGVVAGILNINTIKNINGVTNKEELLKKYLFPYSTKGLDVSLIKFEPSNINLAITNAFISDHNFNITLGGNEQAFNLKIFVATILDKWFYLDILGSTEDEDFEAWAINKRVFQLIIQYLKI